MKTCTKCKVEKDLTEFNKDKTKKSGYDSRCKSCKKIYNKQWDTLNKEYRKEYRLKNLDKIKEKNKKYYLENKDIRSLYYKNNQDKINHYRRKNIDKKRKYQKEYDLNNKEKKRLYNKEYSRKRRLTDPLFKLSTNIRHLINISFKRQGHSKKSKTYKILGCTSEEFKTYIENQFTDGMSWDNQGNWHLDHIYPVSLAKDEEHLLKLNHHTNFQPLWAVDNIRKSNKI